ncbi:hypothetical protein PUR49_05305 [Streptomyces sp. BE147]|nr:hypothetical protein [Streptomyces sp. BE147]MEE1735932.1 hypothetical protein [Streptomyces sp. BE147]
MTADPTPAEDPTPDPAEQAAAAGQLAAIEDAATTIIQLRTGGTR